MGFFKDIRETQRLSKELSRDWDPAAQMREGAATMRRMTQLLQEQADVRTASSSAVPAQATILNVTDTGSRINLEPVLAIDLLVSLPGQPPFPSVLRTPVPITEIAGLRPGQEIAVRVNPAPPHQVVPPWVVATSTAPSFAKGM